MNTIFQFIAFQTSLGQNLNGPALKRFDVALERPGTLPPFKVVLIPEVVQVTFCSSNFDKVTTVTQTIT